MRLIYVQVGNYRRLRDCKVNIESTSSTSLIKNLYGDLGVTLIAGPNGSGKTSLMSFVAQVFHNLQRFPNKIETSFGIYYQDKLGRNCLLYRNTNSGHFWFHVEDEFDLPVKNIGSGLDPEENISFICYENIVQYLPTTVIISVFSLHGEYPAQRPNNFIGDRRVAIYDVAHLYGYNHFRFPSFSRAICVLMTAVKRRTPAVKVIENLIGAKFTGKVRIHARSFGEDISDDEWVPFTRKIRKREKEEEIYVNDMLLTTSFGSELRLSNMSSGQKMLFIRILSILDKMENGALVLIEEPEIHLDPIWSRQLISLFLLFFKEFNAHIIIATHSFSLINAVPNECVLVAMNGKFSAPTSPTLLGNESALSFALYGPALHEVEKEVVKYAERATSAQLNKLFPQLAESGIRYDIFIRMRKLARKANAKSKK